MSEDCLTLSVWTGADEADGGLPVMVWFHGGSHTMGHGNSTIFDGTALARRGAVIVNVNYRLDVLGFLAHPGLSAESEHDASGNYGLLDKLEALRWVKRNIGAFGGDPENVTIFGQSAGSMSVCALVASPLSEGLFRRAIGQSATCLGTTVSLRGGDDSASSAEAYGVRLAKHFGIIDTGAEGVAQLRALDAQELVDAAGELAPPSQMIVDGWVVPEPPRAIFERGAQQPVAMMLGWTADEGTALFPEPDELSRDDLELLLRERFGERAPVVAEAYAVEIAESSVLFQRRLAEDGFFAAPTRTLAAASVAAGQTVYLYRFDRPVPSFPLYLHEEQPFEAAGAPRELGAYHSGELAYVFDSQALLPAAFDDVDQRLADQMASYWVNFARTGNPNGAELPEWRVWTAESDVTMVLDEELRTEDSLMVEKVSALAGS